MTVQAVEELGSDAYVHGTFGAQEQVVDRPDIIARIDPAAVPDPREPHQAPHQARHDPPLRRGDGRPHRHMTRRAPEGQVWCQTPFRSRTTPQCSCALRDGWCQAPHVPSRRGRYRRGMSIVVVEAPSLGEGWLAVSREILERGDIASYDGQATKELALLTLAVERPDSGDPVIAELGDPGWLDWMHRNFFDHVDVPELGNAKSYARGSSITRAPGATRSHGSSTGSVTTPRPVRPRSRPSSRSPTRSYIPCVSMLDFWLREGAANSERQLQLVVYAHCSRLRQEGVREPRRARPSRGARRRRARPPGRPARRAREVGARLRARVGGHGRALQRFHRAGLNL